MSFNASYQPVSPVPGESGYFSAPVQSLDPHLFEGGVKERFRPEIRTWILKRLYDFWDARYSNAKAWSTAWIAGSGISHQWAASRGNGDLDVLIGVDFPLFWQHNPKYLGLSEEDMAGVFNKEFHAELWPDTAEVEFSSTIPGGLKQSYEVTYYVNPRSKDIRDINPYAAFNLTTNTWTVDPPSGADFEHPKSFFDAVAVEQQRANGLLQQYNSAAMDLSTMQPGSPGHLNAQHRAGLVAAQANSMFEDVHLGRQQAFGPGGSGFGDFYNFRWQYHKLHGTAQTLRAIGRQYEDFHDNQQQRLHAGPVDAANVALVRAALWNRGGNGR